VEIQWKSPSYNLAGGGSMPFISTWDGTMYGGGSADASSQGDQATNGAANTGGGGGGRWGSYAGKSGGSGRLLVRYLL
jgi:hypothetical protein